MGCGHAHAYNYPPFWVDLNFTAIVVVVISCSVVIFSCRAIRKVALDSNEREVKIETLFWTWWTGKEMIWWED